MNDALNAPCFWQAVRPTGPGLACRRTVSSLATFLDAGSSRHAEAPQPAATVPAQGPAVTGGEPRGDRPATCIDMDPDEGVVSVRRTGDSVLLGVFTATPKDGSGMCFQPVRSPSVIRELKDDGIIA
jgi:hypothetical protein